MIRNEFAVTKDMYIDWCMETQKKSMIGKFQIFRIALFVIMFGMGTALLISNIKERMFGIGFLALGVFCVFRCVRYKGLYDARYKKLVKIMGEDKWIRIVEFTDDEIIISGGKVTIKNRYGDIKEIRT